MHGNWYFLRKQTKTVLLSSKSQKHLKLPLSYYITKSIKSNHLPSLNEY